MANAPHIRMGEWRHGGTATDLHVLKSGHMTGKTERIHHQVDFTGLIMVVAGHGDFSRDDSHHQEVGPGSFFVIHPGSVFDFGPRPGNTWEEWHLCLRGDRLNTLTQRGWLPCDGAVYTVSDPSALVFHFSRIRKLLSEPCPENADRCACYAEMLLLEIYHDRVQARRDRLTDPTMEAVLDECRRTYAEPIDFHEIAERNAISYSLLRQRMKRITGQAPQHYLTRLRCEAAQRMLWRSDLPIKAIATAVGIPDPYAFSRTFKRTVGTSPLDFRRQARSSWT